MEVNKIYTGDCLEISDEVKGKVTISKDNVFSPMQLPKLFG